MERARSPASASAARRRRRKSRSGQRGRKTRILRRPLQRRSRRSRLRPPLPRAAERRRRVVRPVPEPRGCYSCTLGSPQLQRLQDPCRQSRQRCRPGSGELSAGASSLRSRPRTRRTPQWHLSPGNKDDTGAYLSHIDHALLVRLHASTRRSDWRARQHRIFRHSRRQSPRSEPSCTSRSRKQAGETLVDDRNGNLVGDAGSPAPSTTRPAPTA